MSTTAHEPISQEQLRTPQRMKTPSSSSKFGQVSVPPSPCATSTSSSPATRSVDYSFSTHGTNKITLRYLPSNIQDGNTSTGSDKIIPPSPSRSVLDPHYASRLYGSTPGCHDANNTNPMPPPGIHRGGENSKNTAFFSTPVQSIASDAEEVSNPSVSSSSTQFFTPERQTRTNIQTPSIYSSTRGFYTPQSSPSSKRSMYSPKATPSRNSRLPKKTTREGDKKYSDRFIPSRVSSNLTFSVWDDGRNKRNIASNEDGNTSSGNSQGNDTSVDMEAGGTRQDGTAQNGQHQSQQQPLLNALLRSELLGENMEPSFSSSNSMTSSNNDRNGRTSQNTRTPLREGGNFLRFNQTGRQLYRDEVFRQSSAGNPTSVIDSFNLSPVGIKSSHRLMNMPQKRKRKIAKVPFKVLDAPSLADDFYLNLVDWSSLNVLAVGLGSCVYLWSACTSKVTKLCDLGVSNQDSVTSVAWTQRGTHLAVGVNNGEVQIWDTVKCKKIRTMGGHSARIGALSWSGATLASGSRDRLIYLRDVRIQQPFTARLAAHKQEVCGLKWSFDEPAHLASGGNDNKLLVWDIKNHRQPKHRFAEHTAAVKAIAWSPHQHGLLASGGGTADRCIRFWNALSGTSLNAIDTGSQVCNLSWSKNCNEIVSTHGYSLNQIAIWKYPTMQKVATLTGHTYRVLYLAMSPDGSTIVT
jgi:cell division cycle 20-like protein 1 (cofactor of APC complex)